MNNKIENLANSYSAVLRYGLVPDNENANWSKQANNYSEPDIYSDISHPDNFFADYLQDADDPRHAIVRDDLITRGVSPSLSGFYPKLEARLNMEIGRNEQRPTVRVQITGSKETMDINKIEGEKGVLYKVAWVPTGRGHYLEGLFTPEEFEQFLTDIESDKKLKDFN